MNRRNFVFGLAATVASLLGMKRLAASLPAEQVQAPSLAPFARIGYTSFDLHYVPRGIGSPYPKEVTEELYDCGHPRHIIGGTLLDPTGIFARRRTIRFKTLCPECAVV